MVAGLAAGPVRAIGPDLPGGQDDPPAPVHDADLSITSIEMVSTELLPGRPIAFDLTIRNFGSCPSCGPITVSVWDDSVDGQLDCGDGGSASPSVLVPDRGEATVRIVLNGYPRPGRYRAWFWVDCSGEVPEVNEANNKASYDVVLGLADTPGGPIDPEPDPGQPLDPPNGPGGGSDPPSEPEPPIPDQVGGEPPAEPDAGTDRPPPFCGLFGGSSLLATVGWFAATALGFVGLRRHAWR